MALHHRGSPSGHSEKNGSLDSSFSSIHKSEYTRDNSVASTEPDEAHTHPHMQNSETKPLLNGSEWFHGGHLHQQAPLSESPKLIDEKHHKPGNPPGSPPPEDPKTESWHIFGFQCTCLRTVTREWHRHWRNFKKTVHGDKSLGPRPSHHVNRQPTG